MPTVIIIGAGLVGCLVGSFMARRGFHVRIYEKNSDLRCASVVKGKSINLALSNRGRKALKYLGLEKEILKNAIPMKGRLLHSTTNELKSVLYDNKSHQCIYSVGRNYLNLYLLDALSQYDNVEVNFDHKLMDVNLSGGEIILLNLSTREISTSTADLIIGADGAYSTLRQLMQKTPLFNFSQTFIDHGYMELSIPAAVGNDQMTPNHLHIWPRADFMMIALPNSSGPWTVTLFMPFKIFSELDDVDKLLLFFEKNFPDALELIGKEELIDDFQRSKPAPLVSIKCNPYYYNRKFLVIGDAAHAMVPFYGQGMNAGFEDCLLFDRMLNLNNNNIGEAIKQFSDERTEDAHAICDLAMYNYVEMRDLVLTRKYRFRKMLDDIMYKIFPYAWIPLYNSVTFGSMSYRKCIDNRTWQDKMINIFGFAIVCLLTAGFLGMYNMLF